MARLGVRLDPIPQLEPTAMLDLACVAEQRGYEAVWVPEGGGRDALTQLAVFATATKSLRLGSGILPVFSRTPTVTAMSAAGLDLISNHRFILGLGVGHRAAVEGAHGTTFEKPISRIRETVDIIRLLLKGEKVRYEGKVFSIKNGNLGVFQEFPVPIYIAALGPQMLELAGEIADGVLLNWTAMGHIEEALGHLERGAVRAGRRLDDIDVACYIRVAVTADEGMVRAPLRRQILRYARMDYYRDFFSKTGFAEEIRAVGLYLGQDDRDKAAEAISDKMQQQLAVFGTADFCRREIEKLRGAGIKMPIIAPFPVGGVANSYRATIEAFSG